MNRYLLLLLACLALAVPAFAQEEESGDVPEVPDDAEAEEGSVDDVAEDASAEENAEDAEDSDLDEQTYEEDEDEFIPTEEIPADEPIPFPTNI